MKIKALLFGAIAIVAGSCTKTVEAPISEDIHNVSSARKALLFKFSGLQCGACTAYMDDWETICTTTYPNKVIGLTVHCGVSDTLVNGFTLGMTSQYDIPGTPRFSEGSIMQTDTTWTVMEDKLAATLDKPADVGIGIKHTVTGNTLTINTKSVFFNDLSGTYNIAIYVVENDIHALQTGIPMVHNKVLRGSANGYWGETFAPGTTSKGSIVDKSFTYNLGTPGADYWNTANLKVVAVIYKMENNSPVEVMNCNIEE